MTEDQKAKMAAWQRDRRKRLKEQGLCSFCGKCSPRQGKCTCESCGNKLKGPSKKNRDKRKERRVQGQCSCGNESRPGKLTCVNCNERGLKKYRRKREQGLCANCGNSTLTGKTRCSDCSGKLREKGIQLRTEVYEAYGGAQCACCESTFKFLNLDHANNDGNQHRKQVGRTSVLRWLKDNGFPPGYQVLCWNCNMGKRMNGGVCPHKSTAP